MPAKHRAAAAPLSRAREAREAQAVRPVMRLSGAIASGDAGAASWAMSSALTRPFGTRPLSISNSRMARTVSALSWPSAGPG